MFVLKRGRRLNVLKYEKCQGSAKEIKFCLIMSLKNLKMNEMKLLVLLKRTLFLISVSQKVPQIQPDFRLFH